MSFKNRLLQLYLNLLYVPIYDVTSASITFNKRMPKLRRHKAETTPEQQRQQQTD